MLDFSSLLSAWGSDEFTERLQRRMEQLDRTELPLHQALAYTSYPSEEPIRVVALGAEIRDEVIRVKAMIFYSGIIAGCSCADDPTPVETLAESCTVQLDIDRGSGAATIALLP